MTISICRYAPLILNSAFMGADASKCGASFSGASAAMAESTFAIQISNGNSPFDNSFRVVVDNRPYNERWRWGSVENLIVDGLVVRPKNGTDLASLVLDILAYDPNIPNDKIILDVCHWEFPLKLAPDLKSKLQVLSEDYAISISLKTKDRSLAIEIESLLVGPEKCRQSLNETQQVKFNDLLREVKSDPTALTQRKRNALIKMAELNGPEDAWEILFAIRDFPGLRKIAAKLIEDTSDDHAITNIVANAVVASLLVEDYDAATDHCDRFKEEIDSMDYSVPPCALGWREICDQYRVDYAARKGFDETVSFSNLETIRNLLALAKDYDVFIGIATAGLFSVSIADLLGLPNYVMEIHTGDKKRATSKWIDPVNPEDIAGKRVLLLDVDALTGATVERAVKLLKPLNPSQVGVYFNCPPSSGKKIVYSNGMQRENAVLGGMMMNMLMLISDKPPRPESLPRRAVSRIKSLGVKIHHPGNVFPKSVASSFREVHERLNTPIGRLRRIVRFFDDNIVASALELDPSLADILVNRLNNLLQFYHNLNPLVPGTKEIRERLLASLERTVTNWKEPG